MRRPPRPELDRPRRDRAAASAVVAALVAIVAAGCATGPDLAIRHPGPTDTFVVGPATTQAPAPAALATGPDGLPLATVTATDDGDRSSYDAPAAVAAGPLAIDFTNHGTMAHDLTVLHPKAGATIDQLDALVTGPAPEAASTIADLLGGAGTTAAGATTTVALLLQPGDYELASMARGPDGRLGVTRGLHRRLRVAGPEVTPGEGGAPRLPTVLGAIGLRDDGLDLPPSWAPGWYRVSNTGTQVHDLTFARANDGAKADDVQQWLKSADNGPPPNPAPFTLVGGSAPLSAQTSAWVKLALPTGAYLVWDDQLDRAGDFGPFREKGSVGQFQV
jgi:hypothetical protein